MSLIGFELIRSDNNLVSSQYEHFVQWYQKISDLILDE
jgi:hypothetical protein